MKQIYEPLFTPWKIRDVEFKNRIVLCSMGGTNLLGWMERNHFDKAGAEFILKVAENNVGLLLPGCQPIYNPMYGQWLHKNKRMYRDLAEWLPSFHRTGAKLFVQLTAGFGRSFTISPLMETLYDNPVLRLLSKPILNLDKITASASSLPNRWSDKIPSRPLTISEIEEFVESFARSAKLLQEAGVDGIEVHAVHEGYLLDQFTLKYTNNRTDRYGGSRENRYRFPVEIVQAIKRECGQNFPVSLRYSVLSKTKGFRQGALPGEEYQEVGRDMEESIWAAKHLQAAGYDMLNCDNGTYDAWYWAHPPIYMPENCNLKDVIALREHIDIPVVCAGRLDPKVAAEAVADGKLDGAGFARPFLADQAWVTKLIEEREEHILPCILCHNGCFNMAHYRGVPNVQKLSDTMHLSRCAVNAETLQTDKHYIEPTKNPKTVPIIGGGVGGMQTALVLKARGHSPVIYEAIDRLGGTLVPAGQESYKKRLRDLLDWFRLQIAEAEIPVHLNHPISSTDKFTDSDVVVAIGAHARNLNKIEGHERIIEACDYLSGTTVGETVAVIGGGLTGCEIAYDLHLQGKRPIIVEMQDDLIKQVGVCLANSSYLREYFELHKVPVLLNTALKAVEKHSIKCLQNDQEITLPCDSVISAIGYIPNEIAVTAKRIHLVGDCLSPGNFRTVIWRAWDVAMKI